MKELRIKIGLVNAQNMKKIATVLSRRASCFLQKYPFLLFRLAFQV